MRNKNSRANPTEKLYGVLLCKKTRFLRGCVVYWLNLLPGICIADRCGARIYWHGHLPFPIKTTDSTSGRGASASAEAAPGQRLVETLAKIARHESVDQGVDAAATNRTGIELVGRKAKR